MNVPDATSELVAHEWADPQLALSVCLTTANKQMSTYHNHIHIRALAANLLVWEEEPKWLQTTCLLPSNLPTLVHNRLQHAPYLQFGQICLRHISNVQFGVAGGVDHGVAILYRGEQKKLFCPKIKKI